MNNALAAAPTEALDQKPFHVAFGVDGPYFRYMAVTMASVVQSNPGVRFIFHVFTFGASDEHRAKICELETRYGTTVQIHVIDPGVFEGFSSFSSFSQYSPAIFSRLVIPGALKGVTDRVLYLDADILCVGSIADLRSIDMKDCIVAAVTDHAGTTVKRQVAALNLKHRRYFNSGVLYMNVDNWVANHVTDEVMRTILESGKRLSFPDQDALNIVLDGRALFIDEKWNFRYNLEAVLKNGQTRMGADGEGVFLHFTGRVKPWHAWSLHDSSALFLHYQNLSPWAGTPLDPPKNHKEMRMYSRFLVKQGKYWNGAKWYFQYLARKLSR